MSSDSGEASIVTNEFIRSENEKVLASYTAQPDLIEEQAHLEMAAAQGAYGKRQIFELVQNGADALRNQGPGAIEVLLTRDALYCANQGAPLSKLGVRAILHAYLSPKEGEEIGRYGLGFKSVLGVSCRPEIHSSGVAFRFDPEWTRRQIAEIVPDYVGPLPNLRLARPIDPAWERRQDPVLERLLEWATTVVKLPIMSPACDWLQRHVREFPVEFLLFCPQVSEVRLEDHLEDVKRRLTRAGNGPYSIDDGAGAQEWRTFSREIRPSAAAMEDGGLFAGRERITVQWAVPTRSSTPDGRFWAYFPLLKEKMSLGGALNAPWKLNDDRQNILEGIFNEEALEEAARLVLENLPWLIDKADPGKILEVLPARMEERKDADRVLTQKLYELAVDYPTIPDTTARLQMASDLVLPPSEKDLPQEAVRAWAEADYQPNGWAHASTIANRDRSARIDQLMTRGQMRSPIQKWLEALIPANGSPQEKMRGSRSALLAAAAIVAQKSPQIGLEAKRASIVLCSDGETLVEPAGERVYLPRDLGGHEASVRIVHSDLAVDAELLQAFQTLEISQVDASSELRSLLADVELRDVDENCWDEIWNLVDLIEGEPTTAGRGAEILKARCEGIDPRLVVHVRTVNDRYKPLIKCLQPGDVVPHDGSRDAGVSINLSFHSKHISTLETLGAVKAPVARGGTPREDWFGGYRQHALEALYAEQRERGRSELPQEGLLKFDQDNFAGPISPLTELSPEARVQFTKHLLLSASHKSWTMAHRSRRDNYPVLEVDSPEVWSAKRQGLFATSKGPLAFRNAVGPALRRWSDFFPVADLEHTTASEIGLPMSDVEIKLEIWQDACLAALSCQDDLATGEFFAHFATAGLPRPGQLRCRAADGLLELHPDPVVTLDDPGVISALVAARRPYLLVATEAEKSALVSAWALTPADSCVSVRPRPEGPADPVPLLDIFSGLRSVLPPEKRDFQAVACTYLQREIVGDGGVQIDSVLTVMEGRTIYYDAALEGPQLLDELLIELDVKIEPARRSDILYYKGEEDKRSRIDAIQSAVGVPAKLLAAVGPASLRERIPESAIEATLPGLELSDLESAQLFHGIFGIDSLHELRTELEKLGLPIPQTWAGSHAARKFVKRLGFPPEYAGFSIASYPPLVDVDGPRELPPLHEYQNTLVERMAQFLSGQTANHRGVLSLPTGAGKTRVAVEAVTRAMASGAVVGPVLWVAPTKELCDQAVQSWSEVWSAHGPKSSLRINRFYGGNPADPVDEGYQVIVAIIDKLNAVRDDPDYEWVSEAGAVVVDEAHHSITPEFTALFRFVGADRRSTRCPIIGLSATPYRGGAAETKALASRYEHNRFDEGVLGEHPYVPLQAMGVLARVEHEILDGMQVEMEGAELEELRRLKTISPRTSQRIAANRKRNIDLLEKIMSLDAKWPILVFAASVEHSQALAAALNFRNIQAAAVFGDQAVATRRHYIEKFRQGEIRVLCNYNVLTTGFDAPATRAVIVARPTFSPALYQQMIGRGLRGPKNGGKERCLLVTVRDNFVNYGEELAFTHFEYLWNPGVDLPCE